MCFIVTSLEVVTSGSEIPRVDKNMTGSINNRCMMFFLLFDLLNVSQKLNRKVWNESLNCGTLLEGGRDIHYLSFVWQFIIN